ncbi:MAG: hypothetical protein P8P74_08330 [Crocinitomicaceae bacterium]|nr:hypothetical protein [Crocinitomicaceae bacterium]
MKALFLTSILACLYLLAGCAIQKEIKEPENAYTVLSEEKFKEIEAKVHLQEDWNPIRVEGYSKAELVAFYIQSYSDETVSTWVDFAYKKMNRFTESKPTAEQNAEFKKLMILERTKENMHKFMMLMTTEQIETVGY